MCRGHSWKQVSGNYMTSHVAVYFGRHVKVQFAVGFFFSVFFLFVFFFVFCFCFFTCTAKKFKVFPNFSSFFCTRFQILSQLATHYDNLVDRLSKMDGKKN